MYLSIETKDLQGPEDHSVWKVREKHIFDRLVRESQGNYVFSVLWLEKVRENILPNIFLILLIFYLLLLCFLKNVLFFTKKGFWFLSSFILQI